MYSYTYLRTLFFFYTITFFNLNFYFNAFLLKEIFLDSEQVLGNHSFQNGIFLLLMYCTNFYFFITHLKFQVSTMKYINIVNYTDCILNFELTKKINTALQ